MKNLPAIRAVRFAAATIIMTLLAAACATSPTGRTQFIAVPDSQMNQMGITAFDKMKTSDKLSRDAKKLGTARCVVDSLVAQLPANFPRYAWEVQVFQDDNPNAFALPGGKVGVNTGMWKVAKNQDQLAAVIGHEIGHVIARHGAERVSQQLAAGVTMEAVGAYSGARTSPENTKMILSGLGLGAQLGVLLPFSRTHESEADVIGQEMMARAGFDPQAAVALWQNMLQASSGGRTPQILSTHPDPQNRIRILGERAPSLRSQYEVARSQGKAPSCG